MEQEKRKRDQGKASDQQRKVTSYSSCQRWHFIPWSDWETILSLGISYSQNQRSERHHQRTINPN